MAIGVFGFLSVSAVFYTVVVLPLGDAGGRRLCRRGSVVADCNVSMRRTVVLSFTSPVIAAVMARVLLGERCVWRAGAASD
jgi:hypothetical protein